jgi:DNA-binding Lrp family transcriptional regulator
MKVPKAYVLINLESGSEEQVIAQLKKIQGVHETYLSYGVYDLIVKVEAENMEKLKESVTHKIRTISQVRSTLTLILTETP